jgi:hypothetical protein
LAFHVNEAPHAVLDHNTRTPAMVLTQFMQILLCFIFRNRHTLPREANFSCHTPLSDCRTDSVIRGEIEEDNLYPFIVVTTQGACRRRRRMARTIIWKIKGGERKILVMCREVVGKSGRSLNRS